MVEVSNKHKSITVSVSSNNGNTIVAATSDTAQYWSNQSRTFAKESKDWANKLDGAVDGTEYSAKHYAELASSSVEGFEDVVANKTNNIIATSNDFINQITETANTGIAELEDRTNDLVSEINTTAKSYDNLTNRQISNCLLEVPQCINLTLSDGTLTLKKGSVVTVPYGTTNRTSEFPVGSQFLNSNWKVVDTQFADNKFFVWAELQKDISRNRTDIDGKDRLISVYLDGTLNGATGSLSGTTFSNALGYNTSENTVYWYNTSGVAQGTQLAFPIGIVACGDTYTFGSIKQVFNGMGYIGGTFWCDKGVKGLIPNGRNADGTLKNTELTNSTLRVATVTNYTNSNMPLQINSRHTGWSDFLYIQEEKPNDSYSHWYQPSTNTLYYAGATIGDYTKTEHLIFGFIDRTNGKITGWRPKQAFRALSYDDIKINNPNFFGQYIWSEFAPDNLSWLKSNGQWNSQGAYGDYYDWVLTKANAGTSGFKLSTASYTDYDFVVNTSAKTFRLPIKVQNAPMGGTAPVSVYGNGQPLKFTANVPSSSGFTKIVLNPTILSGGGVELYATNNETWGNATQALGLGITSSYGNSGVVGTADLSNAINSKLSLYFYVGETTRDIGLVNASMALQELSNKTDISQATTVSFPSSKYTVLTMGANNSTYTAPANGYFSICGETVSSGSGYVALINETNQLKTKSNGGSAGTDCSAFIPAKKGDVIKLQYTNFVQNQSYMKFVFIYAEGDK